MREYICVNLWTQPDCDGEYQLSLEYYKDRITDEISEKTYTRKTLAGALQYAKKLQDKYDCSVNLF